ncbi:hypothetical protein EBU71_15210 [bacterium]|nr:hypothetical protein [Candidatus Elulimicrobium humile]
MNTDLTSTQLDYAKFLPATSTFYATFVGKQRYTNYVEPKRIPGPFQNGMESLNFLDPIKGQFYYKWCLYSAGHANLDLTKISWREDMFRNRNRTNSWVLGDSGGFQIGKGKWEGDWKDPNCPKASKKRRQVLEWMDTLMDCGMILDIPSWIGNFPDAVTKTKIENFNDAVIGTHINNEYFIRNRNGNCKFLNVLQGEDHEEAEIWYQEMKKYSDPKQYPNEHFNGWAMGGQNMCDIELILRRIVALRFDNLLEPGIHNWMHFLGTSKLEWAVLLTDIQRAVRKYHNPEFTISYDCASPFLATANGQIYYQTETIDRRKWTYRMSAGLDDKKYKNDHRLYKDAVVQDRCLKLFENSPVMDMIKVNDICVYGPGDLNKFNQSNKTSWDSFSYGIMMCHNIWHHINAVQEANRQYDNQFCPAMLVNENSNRVYFRELINAIFSTSDRGTAESLIDDFEYFWVQVIGTRGASGKRAYQSKSKFRKFFKRKNADEEILPLKIEDGEFDQDQYEKLEELEMEVEDDIA